MRAPHHGNGGGTVCRETSEPTRVLLSIEKKSEEIHAYIDSGANAHIFKHKSVFNVCERVKPPHFRQHAIGQKVA